MRTHTSMLNTSLHHALWMYYTVNICELMSLICDRVSRVSSILIEWESSVMDSWYSCIPRWSYFILFRYSIANPYITMKVNDITWSSIKNGLRNLLVTPSLFWPHPPCDLSILYVTFSTHVTWRHCQQYWSELFPTKQTACESTNHAPCLQA
jgi:hypothetical protein